MRCLLLLFFFLITSFRSLAQCAGFAAHAGPDVSICNGASAIIGSAASPGGTAPYTYSWSPVTGLSNPAIAQPTAFPATTTTYTLTVTDVNTCTATDQITVTVWSKPNITFTANPNTPCSGQSVQFTSNITGGTPAFTYAWSFGGGGSATTANPTNTFTSSGCGTQIFSNAVIITDSHGCKDTTTNGITVNKAPNPALLDLDPFSPFSNCDNSPTTANPSFILSVNNSTTNPGCISSYSIDWGDGSAVQSGLTSASFPLSHTYNQLGAFYLIFSAIGTNGCAGSTTYPVANQSIPAIGISTLGNTSGCAPQTFKFILHQYANNSPGTYYVWNFGDGTPNITWNYNQPFINDTIYHTFTHSACPGSSAFTVRVTAHNLCDSAVNTYSPVIINISPQANFSVNPNPACVGQNVCFSNLTIAGYGTSCNSAAVYTWNFGDPASGGSNTSNAVNPCHIFNSPGNYTITLTASNSCGPTHSTQTICVTPQPVPGFTLNNTIGCTPLAVTATNTSNTLNNCGAATYNWTVSYSAASPCGTFSSFSFTGGTSSSSVNPSFSFSSAGTYTITLSVTNPCGTFSTSQSVTVKRPPIISNVTTPNNSCGPVSANPTASVSNCGTSALSYAWTFGGGTPGTSTSANPTGISFSSVGSHTITLAATNECGTTSGSTSFTIYPTPVANAGNDVTICSGQSTTLTGSASSGTPTYSYHWTSSPAGTNSFSQSISVAPTVTTTYTLTVTDANFCPGTDVIVVTVNPTPTIGATANPAAICVGLSSTLIATGNATSFIWTPSGSLNVSNNDTVIATPAATTNYTVTGSIGSCSATANVTVTVNPLPVVNAGNHVILCNQPIPYSLTGNTPAGGTWTGANVTSGGVFTPNGNGNFILTYSYTNANNCTATDTVSITVGNAQAAAAGNGFTVCVNGGIQNLVNGTPVGGTWSGTGVVASTFNPLTSGAGAFTLTYTFGAGTCVSTDTIHVLVNAQPTVTVNSPTICVGFSSNLNANGANSYSWSPAGGLSGTTGATVTANPVVTTVYTVTGTNNLGCSSTALSTVTVNTLPVVNAGTNVTLCNQPIPYNLVGFSPAGGTWSGSGVTAGGVFTPTGIGNFILTYTFTNVNNCTNQDTMTITVINPQIANAGNGFSICINANPVVLGGAIPAGGTWSGTGVSGGSFIPSTAGAGTFNLTYTFGSGTCLTTDTIHVTVNALPIMSVNSPAICVGGSVALNANGGNTYAWSPSGGLSGTTGNPVTANPIVTTVYTVTGTNIFGCSASANSTVTVNILPVVNAGTNVILCNQPIPYNLAGFSLVGGTWSGSGVTAGGVFTPSAIGNFILTYSFTNANNCTSQDTMTVTVINPQIANAGNGFSICVNGNSMGLNATPAGGTWTGTGVSGTNFIPANAGAGTFVLTYTFGAGTCLTTDTIQVVVNPLPVVNVNSPSICIGNSVLLTANGASAYSWSPGTNLSATTGTSVTANPNVTTVYTVTGTNVFGCFASVPSTVTMNPLPVVSFTNPALGCINVAINFNNTSTGGNTCAWNFGDGGTSALQNPSHSYTTAGNYTIHLAVTTALGCVDSITHPIQIVQVANVNFTLNPAIGCTPLNVTFNNTSTGYNPSYSWNFGNGQTFIGVTPPVITFTQGIIGDTTYYITLTSNNTCGNSTHTDSVLVHPKPIAHFLPSALVGCSPFVCSFLNTTTGNPTSFLWNFGDGSPTSILQNPGTHTFVTGNNDTTYTVTMIAYNACGSDTVSIPILVHPNTVVAFAVATPTTGCAPLTVSFSALAQGATSVSWNFGNSSFSNQLNTTSLYNAGNYVAFFYANDGCSYDTVAIPITVGGNPNMQFTFAPNPVCEGSPITFTNQTLNLINVNWEFGDGTVSNLVNPTHLYSPAGTYNVTLIGTSVTFGCIDSITHPVTVVPTPVNNVTFTPTIGCAPLPVSFSNNTVNGTFYNWDFGDQNTSAIMSPVHVYQNAGTFTITLISSTVNGCADTSTYSILVNPSPVAAFTMFPPASCSYPVNVLTANATTGATGYNWNYGNGQTSTLNNPIIVFDTTGDYSVQLIASNGFNCSDTAVNIFHVYPQPLAGFVAVPIDGCEPLLVKFTDTSHDAVTYTWNFGDGGSSVFNNPVHIYQNPGTYSVTLFVNGTNGFCSDSARVNNYITVYPKPTAAFNWTNINSAAPNAEVIFANGSSGSSFYNWSFGDGDTAALENPFHYYHDLGNFDVILISISDHGCLDTAMETVHVDFAHGLFVPNAFSPNSGPEEIRSFLPKGLGLRFYHIRIYDTWGTLLWESTSLDETGAPNEPWNGTKNGINLPQDAYVWKIDAIFQDDQVWVGNTYNGKSYSTTGTVTVLR